ncbi:MAG: homocysteine biosynthesis protein, partial [bacterium]
PIPILDREVLEATTVRDRDIYAPVIDYSRDYPEKTGNVLARISYEDLKSGEVIIEGRRVEVGSLSSYSRSREIAAILKEEIEGGEFLVSPPLAPLPADSGMKPLVIKEPQT